MYSKYRNFALGYLDIILLLLFGIFVCVISTTKIIEDDVFIHLETGKYIAENKTVPSADMFGYVTEGTKWIPYEWLWQVTTYLVWKTGGYVLLSVFRSSIIVLLFLLCYLALKKLKIPVPIFIILGIIMCLGMFGRFSIRPHILSYVFLISLTSILFYYKFYGLKDRRLLYSVPFIFLLWANIHMSVLLGLAVFSIFLFSETITYRNRNGFYSNKKSIFSYSELKQFYIMFAVSCAAILINPHFIDTYSYVYRLLTLPELVYTNEWISPFDERFISGYYVIIYLVFLVLGLSILYYSYKTKEIFHAILFIVLSIFSMKSLRYTGDFMVVIVIPLAVSLNYLLKKLNVKVNHLNSPAVKSAFGIALVFITLNTYNNDVYKFLDAPFKETGFGVNGKYYPERLFDFMEKQKICEVGTRPFNSMRVGGYFLWSFNGKKDFVDNRCLSSEIINEYFNINFCKPGFEEKLKQYDIDYIIYSIPTFTSRPVEIEMNLVAYLSKSSGWKLVYWDDISFLFVRNDDKFSDIISKYEFKYLTPVNCYFHRNIIAKAMKNDSVTLMQEINRKLYEDKNGDVINDIVKYLNLKSISSLE